MYIYSAGSGRRADVNDFRLVNGDIYDARICRDYLDDSVLDYNHLFRRGPEIAHIASLSTQSLDRVKHLRRLILESDTEIGCPRQIAGEHREDIGISG